MKTKTTLSTAILIAGLSIASISCSDNKNDPKENAEEMNDAKFDREGEREADKLVEACASNLFEIKVSENAEMNATTPEVKKLASMMVSGHSKMNEDVRNLAMIKNVTLPSELSEDQRKKIESLSEKTGIDYDKEYTKLMEDKHEHAVDFYKKTADKCDDPEIRSWAESTLNEVKSHLDMVKSARHIVSDMK